MSVAPVSAKIMILGAVGVGKTSLVKRFVHKRFDADYKTTIGVDIQTCEIDTGHDGASRKVKLMLWDTDGDFGQRIFDTAYVRGASGAIVVADASRPPTIEKMTGLVRSFDANFPGRALRAVVNKIDLVDPQSLDLAALGLGEAEILLTSARSGEGVEDLFAAIAAEIVRRLPA